MCASNTAGSVGETVFVDPWQHPTYERKSYKTAGGCSLITSIAIWGNHTMSKENNSCIHGVSIRTTPETLWEALTTPDLTRKYWFGYRLEADWSVGSTWKLTSPEGQVHAAGEIVEIDRSRRIVLTWQDEIRLELTAEGYSHCTIDLEPKEDAVMLTITQSIDHSDSKLIALVATSWPKVVSNLKSFVEMGDEHRL